MIVAKRNVSGLRASRLPSRPRPARRNATLPRVERLESRSSHGRGFRPLAGRSGERDPGPCRRPRAHQYRHSGPGGRLAGQWSRGRRGRGMVQLHARSPRPGHNRSSSVKCRVPRSRGSSVCSITTPMISWTPTTWTAIACSIKSMARPMAASPPSISFWAQGRTTWPSAATATYFHPLLAGSGLPGSTGVSPAAQRRRPRARVSDRPASVDQ